MGNRRPHICFVAPNAFPLLAGDRGLQVVGGAELQQVFIGRGLVERGYQVSMICLDFGQPDALNIDGIVVHRAYRPTEGIPVLRFVWPRLTEIWKCLARANADIYYQRAASVLTGVMAAYTRRHGRKSIFAVAGDPMIRFARDRRIYEYGVKTVDCVLVQNEAQRDEIRQQFGRDSVLVPNCHLPTPAGSGAVRSHVLWVSTIRQLKRPELFLDLAEMLPDYRFTMVGGPGEGEEVLFEKVLRRADRLANVDFAGFVPYAEIGGYFDRALLFVNTSETEGFPNTFLQSWARRVPTVSFIDCGARFNGDPVGLTAGTLEELARTISGLLEDGSWRARLGEASEAYVRMNHHPERVLNLYEELFRRIQSG